MRQLLLLFLLLPGLAAAQAVFTGLITDKTNREPLTGVTVYFPDLRKGSASDTSGLFRVADVPPGSHKVQVRYLGYKSQLRTIRLPDGETTTNFVLEPEAGLLQEVIVTGLTTGATVKDSPVPIMTYNKIQWLQTSSTNLVDAVGKLPGMSQITTGVGLSKPVIRGLGFNRVITVHDGVRQEDNQWGEEHALQVDEYSIDRYEIIKGSGSLLYGSDGLGGVMSLISARPPEAGAWRGQVLTNYQSNNGMFGLSGLMEGTTKKGLFARVRVSHKNAGNYQNRYDGRVYGSAYRELDMNGTIGINRKWGYSQVYLSNFHQDINIVTGERDRNGGFLKLVRTGINSEALQPVSAATLNGRAIDLANYQNLNHAKISWNTFAKLSGGSLSAIMSYSQNRRQEFATTLTPEPALYFYLQNVFYDLKYYFGGRQGWDFTVGGNGLWQYNQNLGSQVLYPGYRSWDNGLFLFAQKKTDRLTVNGGLRMDIRQMRINQLYADTAGIFAEAAFSGSELRFAGLNKTYSNPTASFGATYALSGRWTVKANLGRGFRAPSTPELSANGEHTGTFRYEIGSPNLRSETSWQGDLGINYESPSLNITASLFQNRINNYTYSEKVFDRFGRDSIVDPSRPILTYRYTQGNAVLFGGEAQVIYNPQLAKWFHLTGSYSLVRSRNLSATADSSRYLPFLPPPRVITQVKFTKAEAGNHWHNLYAQVEVESNARQNQALLAYGTETQTPGYTLINLGAGGDIVGGKANRTLFSLYLTVQNVFDVAYQSHQNRLKYFGVNETTGRAGVFNMGRNVSAKVVVPLGKEK
ncbi:TonB-dependent receptor [Spirosoma utsteinense]|uniref:Iron complex outermembrane receptor protein n=1 Tax=Spirosoma utsteinense TaxID=2585773 RepID=A0ABR6W7E2_9BACT|nr:TonB-dependent receptor [Spirosoma utsteinense]MBC3784942.1 iron complex outermembrane receptor protein [Spirosoma utsteinense]MBC3792503.1 iron complex outermembrane receptor protein [Spirosoma utsteinense]